jgi:hypothetical protein
MEPHHIDHYYDTVNLLAPDQEETPRYAGVRAEGSSKCEAAAGSVPHVVWTPAETSRGGPPVAAENEGVG